MASLTRTSRPPNGRSALLAPANLRAAAYVRVSSEEQTDGHSLDAQRRAITAACQERGWEILHWYADEGVSAHTDDITKRPAFHEMIQDAQDHRFDAVIVHKLDRFARSVVVALGTFKLLDSLGITFLSLSEQGMDFTTPMGKVLFGMLSLLAEYYSENLGQETRKGKAERRAKGLHNGLVPFGYRSADGAVAEHDPETAPGARLAFQLAADGQSLRQVAQALNQAGYRTAGNQRRGVFTKDTVRDLLANRFYLGELPVFEPGASRRIRAWQAGKHEALIDPLIFEAARAAIGGRTRSAMTRQGASVYSLSGLLRCRHCGERMRAVKTPSQRVRYHCRSRVQGLNCPGKGSFLDVYEDQIAADLAAFKLPDQWKEYLLGEAARDQSGTVDPEQRRRQLESRLARIKELYAWGDLTRDEYQTERTTIEQELVRLVPVEQQDDRLSAIATYLEDLPAAWADADQALRNKLANVIYEEVWVNGPVVEFVKPRPELEPLFQVRTGACQPLPDGVSIPVSTWRPRWGLVPSGANLYLPAVSAATPKPKPSGRSGRLVSPRLPKIPAESYPVIASASKNGVSLRALARRYGVSHETVRRAIRTELGAQVT